LLKFQFVRLGVPLAVSLSRKEAEMPQVVYGSEVFKEKRDIFWKKMVVRIKFRDMIVAGIPAHEEPLEYYIATKFRSDEEKVQFRDRIKRGLLTEIEKEETKDISLNIFERDEKGNLVLHCKMVKACLRVGFGSLGYIGSISYSKDRNSAQTRDAVKFSLGGKQLLQHGIAVDPFLISLLVDGKPYSGAVEKMTTVKHIEYMGVSRSAIGVAEFLKGPELEFLVRYPRISEMEDVHMLNVLAFCQDEGLGASRSQGYGKFDVQSAIVLEESEAIQERVAIAVQELEKAKAKKGAKKEVED
jgi:hypothetical protein